jgi:hypothetical protein
MFHEVAGPVGRPPLRWAGFGPDLDDSVRQLFGMPPECPLRSEFPYRLDGIFNTVKNLVPFEDDQWMKFVITVKDGIVTVKVNDKELVNYQTEAATTKLLPDGGTLAIQAHDKGSTTLYKNIRIKVTP